MLPARGTANDNEEERAPGWCTLKTGLTCLFVGSILTISILVFGVYGHTKVISYFLNMVPEDPSWTTALVIASINFTCCVCCLAFWALGQMVMAFVFGFWKAFAINLVTLLLATGASFVIGRYLFRDYIRRQLMFYPQASKAAKMIEKEEYKFLILFRALPLPLFLKNYLPPVLKVSPAAVFVSTLVSGLLYGPLFCMIGAGSQSLAALYAKENNLVGLGGRKFEWDPTQVALLVIALVSLFTLIGFATYEWRKLTNELEPLDPDGLPRTVEEDGKGKDE